jgi:shikimate kinase
MMKIFLIGFMGSGKSTLGPKLARALGIPFFDLDKMIEECEGMSIPSLFEQKGETAFRQIEAELLRSTTLQNDAFLLSTGGGAPVFHDNMGFMNQHGCTIYLEMNPKSLAQRLAPAKAERPLLKDINDDDLPEFIASKLKEREVHYKKAHLITSGLSPNAHLIAGIIKEKYQTK